MVVTPSYSPGSSDSATWSQPLADGSILVVGNSELSSPPDGEGVVIAHYRANGQLDTSYGGNGTGRALYKLGVDWLVAGRGGGVDSLGNLLVGATSTDGPDYDFTAIRFTASGALDLTFNNTKGFRRFAFTNSSPHLDSVGATMLDDTLRPVMVGMPDTSGQGAFGNPGFGVARLTSAGLLDTSFGP